MEPNTISRREVKANCRYPHCAHGWSSQIPTALVESIPGLCGLSYRSTAARVGRDTTTVSRMWNRWFQDGNMERRAGSQRPPITSSREDRHVTRMTLMDHASMSGALSQELGSFARQQVST
ncbi:HTH_Tnp_Tc3_2 domain-containing protein [Trichonephila clavipes]|nr:HTH_Tnp_Tc3_2 domain-containing protein [Trichonephila clavipes]